MQVYSLEDGPVHDVWRSLGVPVTIIQTYNQSELNIDWLKYAFHAKFCFQRNNIECPLVSTRTNVLFGWSHLENQWNNATIELHYFSWALLHLLNIIKFNCLYAGLLILFTFEVQLALVFHLLYWGRIHSHHDSNVSNELPICHDYLNCCEKCNITLISWEILWLVTMDVIGIVFIFLLFFTGCSISQY